MRVSLLIGCCVLLVPAVFLAQEKKASDKKPADKPAVEKAEAEPEEKETPPRVDLIRFLDFNKHEHVYTYGEEEPQHWREQEGFTEELTLGKVALTKEKGTVPLYRARSKDGLHYFWLNKPIKIKQFELDDFHIYVWPRGGDGRIAINACSLPDMHDMFMDPATKRIDDCVEETLKGTGVRRRVYPKMFWVYPPDKKDEEEAAE